MFCPGSMNKGGIGGPAQPCYWPRRNAGIERCFLIDKSQSVTGFYQPLNIDRRSRETEYLWSDSDLCQHLHQSIVRRWMYFRIREHFQSFRDF